MTSPASGGEAEKENPRTKRISENRFNAFPASGGEGEKAQDVKILTDKETET